jgi:peptidase M28-like protein/type IX secretion system substrate protein
LLKSLNSKLFNIKIALIIVLLIFIKFNISIGQSLSYNQQIQDLADSVNISNIENHIAQLCWADGHQSRVTFTPGNYYAAEYIAQYFESIPGISTVKRDTFHMTQANNPYNGYPLVNIIATLEGINPDSGMILLGGHYDASGSHESNWSTHWSTIKAQGADDNATGVASLMEVARILSDPVNNFDNTKTIKFIAFAAEEYHPEHSSYHHLGSLYDAQETSQQNIRLDAVVILDMIGYNPITDYVEIISDNPSLWLTNYIYDSVNYYVPNLATNSTPVDVPYSDHDSYQLYGYSAILLMENDRPWNDDPPNYQSNPFYHSIGDSIGTLNFSVVEKVAKTAVGTIAHLSEPVISRIEFEEPAAVIENFVLNVYPNPFNSSTTISFDIKKDSRLSIKVFNLAGQKIADLGQKRSFSKGAQSIRWNANNIASGIYILNINGDLLNINHKLVLIK